MKNILLAFIFITLIFSANAQTADSVDLNPGYTNQVFYTFPGQMKTSVPFSSWDIGFQTSLMNASIISNENSIVVYKVPGADSTDYATLDVSGYASWPILYNSDTTWNKGCFNQTADAANPFDFGWGIYDFNTHEVYGDSLFAIKKGSDIYKFWIRKKTGTDDYIIRYANVTAGGADVNLTLSAANYADKNFIYLNLDNPAVVDFEPVNCCWQILFTHYLTNLPYVGYYPVTGVFSASGVTVAKAYPVDVATDSFQLHENDFVTNLTTIGYDWKTFDLSTFQYIIEDSLIYYVKDAYNYIWSLQFTGFDDVNGKIYFNEQLVHDPTLGIQSVNGIVNNAQVYPNPVSKNATVIFDAARNANINLTLVDVCGKNVMESSFKASVGLNSKTLSLPLLTSGVYHLIMNDGNKQTNLKVVIAN